MTEKDALCIRPGDPPVNACHSLTAEMWRKVVYSCDHKSFERRIRNSQEK